MADISFNGFIDRIRGKFGEIVVKRLGNRTFLAKPPKRKPDTPPTEDELERRQRFVRASAYGHAAANDAAARAFYGPAAEAQGRTVYAIAAADYSRVPTVSIDLKDYAGRVGDKIVLFASDAGPVASVDVAIRSDTGSTLEHGPAVFGNGLWTYPATTNLASHQVVTVEATAKDRPGNTGTATQSYTKP